MQNITVTPITESRHCPEPSCPKTPHHHVIWVPVYLPILSQEEQRLQSKMHASNSGQMMGERWEDPWWITVVH